MNPDNIRRRSLGQVLLSAVKGFDGWSPDDLDRVDCVQIKCARSGGSTRAVHRCVLEIGSEVFAEEISKLRLLRGVEGEYWSNSLLLDISVEMMDIILGYLYTGEAVNVNESIAIEACATAKRFGLHAMMEQTEQFLQRNIAGLLGDDNFWTTLKYAADVDLLASVCQNLQLDDASRIRLMKRFRIWDDDDNVSEILAPATVDESLPAVRMVSSSTSRELSGSANEANVAVVGRKSYHDPDYVITAIAGESVAGTLGCARHCSAPNWRSVIYNNELYIPDECKLRVHCLSTSQLVREVPVTVTRQAAALSGEQNTKVDEAAAAAADAGRLSRLTNALPWRPRVIGHLPLHRSRRAPRRQNASFDVNGIRGVRVFGREVFFYTPDDIYALDSHGMNCKKIAHANIRGLFGDGFIVLNSDLNEVTIGVPIYAKLALCTITFGRGGTVSSAIRSDNIQTIPKDMLLVGRHDGLNYFCTINMAGPPFHYAAFRGDAEVERHQIADCHRARFWHISNGLLYVLYFSNDDPGSQYLCGIDLDTNTVVIKKSPDQLPAVYTQWMIPVVGASS